jgi:hypothetical protein
VLPAVLLIDGTKDNREKSKKTNIQIEGRKKKKKENKFA